MPSKLFYLDKEGKKKTIKYCNIITTFDKETVEFDYLYQAIKLVQAGIGTLEEIFNMRFDLSVFCLQKIEIDFIQKYINKEINK